MNNPQSYAASPRPPAEAYDLAAPFYDGWQWQKFWREHESPFVEQSVKKYMSQANHPPSILDVGCGTGWYLEKLASLTPNVFGIDISAGMLSVARSRIESFRLIHDDIRRFVFQKNLFDIILCTRVLSHIQDIDHVFHSFEQAISPFGVLVISDIDSTHNYKFTKLPHGNSVVYAETFKHDIIDIDNTASNHGFFFEGGLLISNEAKKIDLRHPSQRSPWNEAAGWVGIWRQLRKERTGTKLSLSKLNVASRLMR